MILFVIITGLLISYFIFTMNINSSGLSKFFFGEKIYKVYEVRSSNYTNQNKKAK